MKYGINKYQDFFTTKDYFLLALISVGVSNLFLRQNPGILLFIVPLIYLIYFGKFKLQRTFFLIAFGILIGSLVGAPIKTSTTGLQHLNKFFNFNTYLIEFVERSYNPKLANFINLLMFNYRRFQNDIYQTFNELGIAHLIIVSGMHLIILRKIIFYCLGSKNCFTGGITLLIYLFYGSAVNYNITVLRVMLAFLLYKNSDIQKGSKVVLLSVLFNFKIYTTYSFILSNFISLIICLIMNLKHYSKMLKGIIINIIIFIFVHAIFLQGKPIIKPMYFLNNYLMFPIIIFIFCYFCCCGYIFFLEPIHQFIFISFKGILNSLDINQIAWNIKYGNAEYSIITINYLCFFFIIAYYGNNKNNV